MSTIILSLLLIILSPVIVAVGFIVLGIILFISAIGFWAIFVLVVDTVDTISDFIHKLLEKVGGINGRSRKTK